MLKNQLTSKVAGIILKTLREQKGRLTQVSDLCKINRREFNIRGLSKMKFHRQLRIIYALAVVLPALRYEQLMNEVSNEILDFADEVGFDFFDE